MPIVFQNEVVPGVKVAVWHITESIGEIFPMVHNMDRSDVKDIFLEKKKLETIATRILLQKLVVDSGLNYHGTLKDVHGKPHLSSHDAVHVSISHSFPYAAAILDKHGPTGIDIESPREQINRIKHKFLSHEELNNDLDIDELTKLWCAKECLYKIYGRRSVIFSKDIRIKPHENGLLTGEIDINNNKKIYELGVEKISEHWLIFKTVIKH